VIFGASGDLTKRKLIPALYNLARGKVLPSRLAVIGYARTPLSHEAFRARMREALAPGDPPGGAEAEALDRFLAGVYYQGGDPGDPEGYRSLAALLAEVERARGTGPNRVFYLAVPPGLYGLIIRHLGGAGLTTDGGQPTGWSRVIIEKPFGRDLASAQALNHEVAAVLSEPQVYRIDHYLGKETVQNILAFRFGNSIFEPLWNRRYVDHVQILVAEDLGVEGRGGYYDQAGALRDMVQNHMLQLLSLVAMEPPSAFEANAVRDEKVKVLRSLRPVAPAQVEAASVRAQYGPGLLGGQPNRGYRHEPGVAADSRTETYVALKLQVDNWRWAGVPFYLRTGKALPRRLTEVTIQFRQPPLLLFERAGAGEQPIEPNRLSLRIQPDEGISLRFGLKPPGPRIRLVPVTMAFGYQEGFGAQAPEAYERLLLDCMLGDATLFIRQDEVEAAWALVTPVLQAWEAKGQAGLATYAAGTWGPAAADVFIARDGREWATF
jgi:glucose-6-phosphate 1-dehydrogenase